ncbi:MAG TPA: hypothetical protein VFT98_02840 [Myxococcota bacterium]|nr:hypothetical protein [Myxococcota bacterium]
MAKITKPLTLKHQSNLSEDVEEISLAPGDAVTVLKEWDRFYLVKNDDGKLFNVPKDAVAK